MSEAATQVAQSDTSATKITGSWANIESHFDNSLTHPWYKAVFLLSAAIASESNRYFENLKYLPALAPVTAHSISSPMGLGSDSLPVEIDLFGKPTYLVDSMQFHLEYLLRIAGEGVYYIMPTFRGEDSDARHLNEFFHIEAELKGNLDDMINTVNGLIGACARRVLDEHGSLIRSITGSTSHIAQVADQAQHGFRRVRFSEAVELLGDDPINYNYLNGKIIGMTSLAERRLMQQLGEPLWLTHLPRMGVPFYQADADGEYAACADLLMGIGEVAGCGQRHTTFEEASSGIAVREVDPAPYAWYLRMKRDYPMSTAGFGVGLERLLLWMLKHEDIRDTQIFIRQKDIYGIP